MDISRTYDKTAKTWSQKANKLGYNSAYAELFDESVSRYGRVLDVGTGTGDFALSWITAGGSKDLTLLDPSLGMLQQAETNFAQCGLAPNVVEGKLEDFHDSGQFNVVLASHVIEHFQTPKDAFRMLTDLIEPGGRLFLSVSKPHWCNWIIWMRYRHRWYAAETVKEIAQQAGLFITRIHEYRSGPPSRTSIGYILTKPIQAKR